MKTPRETLDAEATVHDTATSTEITTNIADADIAAADTLAFRELADTLRMLGRMLNVVPDPSWTPSLVAAIDSMDNDAPGVARMQTYVAEHRSDEPDKLVEAIAVDWTLAFRGMNPARGPRPPYAGAWMSSDGTGIDLMLAINTHYVNAGLASSGNHLNRHDYLGVQLEFLAHLFDQMDTALDDETRREAAHSALRFTEKFILPWLPRYRAQVEERCSTELWKGFLELTNATLSDLRDQLNA